MTIDTSLDDFGGPSPEWRGAGAAGVSLPKVAAALAPPIADALVLIIVTQRCFCGSTHEHSEPNLFLRKGTSYTLNRAEDFLTRRLRREVHHVPLTVKACPACFHPTKDFP